jgi:non-canonical purine NTP pyrophosphatase (RdgB/HAM1 family)
LEKQEIVLASNNPGKVKEINELLNGTRFHILPQSRFDVVEAEETGLTFIENALLKARNAARYTDHPVIADDSGIEVLALKGKPGIYSARYAGGGASDEDNLNKLIEDIKPLSEEDRKARFICLMVFLRHAEDPVPIITQGIWDGYVITAPCGENGFGYDPMFYVPTHDCTSAELSPDIKNQLSHRGQALKQMVKKINLLIDRD